MMDSRHEIYFRADGDSVIGMGHLVRSIALAGMLQEIASCRFFCRAIPAGLQTAIRDAGMGLSLIADEQAFFDEVNDRSVVVLDGYGFDLAYQRELKQKGSWLICIDDLADRPFAADLIINHAYGITEQQYNAPDALFALGPDYALLRLSFLRQAKHPVQQAVTGGLLICFGGSDPENKTLTAVGSALKNGAFHPVTVVTGPGYQYSETLAEFTGNGAVRYLNGLTETEMLHCFSEAETVIVPCSGMLLEALALQKRIISGMYIENQRFLYEQFQSAGAFTDAGTFQPDQLDQALENSRNAIVVKQLIDGFSAERIEAIFLRLLQSGEMILRKAVPEDLELTYTWATDEVIRASSFNRQKIEREEHSAWFLRKIADEQCLYLVAELGGTALGSLRFDLQDENAVISYLVDPAFQGKGYGKKLLEHGLQRLRAYVFAGKIPLKTVSGQVFVSNIPSVKVFEKLNFAANRREDIITFTMGFHG